MDGENDMSTQTSQRSKFSSTSPARRVLLAQLDDIVCRLNKYVLGLQNPELAKTGEWSAKDTLGHIAFWHESFARNVSALAEGRQPNVLVGAYVDLNQRSVDEARRMSVAQIAERIEIAQAEIRKCILTLPPHIQIPYRKGSRTYTPAEHLQMVQAHIAAHLRKIERKRKH
jgi:hypothetical protein